MRRKVSILVTIDTECDKGAPGWDIARPMSFKNIALQKSLLMPLFEKYGIVPTFLISPEVLQDSYSVEILKSIESKCELGTHMHIEFIEPNTNFNATSTEGIQADLSYDEEYLKMKNLTELFFNTFGYYPKSFRSGRFGSSKNTIPILSELGYKVDSSIVPFTTKFFKGLYINNWGRPLEPYWESFDENKILQVPVSLINRDYNKLPFFLKKGLGEPNSIAMRLAKKLGYSMKTEWLRPYKVSGKEMIGIADYIINSHFKKEDHAIVNIMFHSNEILVNGSPYCKSDEDVEKYLASLEELFNYISQNYKLCSTGLGDVSTIYSQN